MTNQHPITPPPELVQEWYEEAKRDLCGRVNWVAVKAAQWGADQELEACCEWLANGRNHSLTWEEATNYSSTLRAARRPKPPSLAEEALEVQQRLWDGTPCRADDWRLIRCALERLQELEGGND